YSLDGGPACIGTSGAAGEARAVSVSAGKGAMSDGFAARLDGARVLLLAALLAPGCARDVALAAGDDHPSDQRDAAISAGDLWSCGHDGDCARGRCVGGACQPLPKRALS